MRHRRLRFEPLLERRFHRRIIFAVVEHLGQRVQALHVA